MFETSHPNRGSRSGEALADFVTHLFAKSFPAGGPLLLIDIPPVEDVEIFQDRMAIAGHGQNEKEFACRSAGAGHFPSAYCVGAIAPFKPTKLCHVGGGQRPADCLTEILAKLFQFRACHECCFLIWRRPSFPRYGDSTPQDAAFNRTERLRDTFCEERPAAARGEAFTGIEAFPRILHPFGFCPRGTPA